MCTEDDAEFFLGAKKTAGGPLKKGSGERWQQVRPFPPKGRRKKEPKEEEKSLGVSVYSAA